VHTNCQDLTFEQLNVLITLYQVFERSLFDFIGEGRDKNIFCVPWYETTLSSSIITRIQEQGGGALKGWQKYTALNLLPLTTQGTIEFRHMAGTNDIAKILEWLRIIGCMYAYTADHPLIGELRAKVVELNTNSQYRAFFNEVFPPRFTNIIERMDERKLEEGVVQTKYALIDKGDLMVAPYQYKEKQPAINPFDLHPAVVNAAINPRAARPQRRIAWVDPAPVLHADPVNFLERLGQFRHVVEANNWRGGIIAGQEEQMPQIAIDVENGDPRFPDDEEF
jgi:hypothetical protein